MYFFQMFGQQPFEGSTWLNGKKGKLGRLSTFEGILQHQDHVKMNIHILWNAMAVQRWNDQKVVNCDRVKA